MSISFNRPIHRSSAVVPVVGLCSHPWRRFGGNVCTALDTTHTIRWVREGARDKRPSVAWDRTHLNYYPFDMSRAPPRPIRLHVVVVVVVARVRVINTSCAASPTPTFGLPIDHTRAHAHTVKYVERCYQRPTLLRPYTVRGRYSSDSITIRHPPIVGYYIYARI